MKATILVILAFSILSCSDSDSSTLGTISNDNSYEIINEPSYNDLISNIGEEKLALGVEEPNSAGALGRNKDSYFHVRFQVNMNSLSDYVVVSERYDALQHLMNTIQYAFDKQLAEGDFEFSPPEELLNAADYSPPVTGDLESGTAFFASSLGVALISLQNSAWFNTSQETQEIKEQLASLNPAFEKTLDYLLSKKNVLQQYDAIAPNRLLFDALAYYALGSYLSRPDAQEVAVEFIESALNLIDPQEGYFIEGGGWDSSYNGVAIKLAMELFALVDDESKKDRLNEAILSATTWQMGRIKENGEVTTEGNTRVYEGGELFLGAEKGVDYVKIVRAFYYFGTLANAQEVIDLGDKVLDFYD